MELVFQVRPAFPAAGAGLAASDSAVWVAEGPPDAPGRHGWKIDPTTNKVVGQILIPARFVTALDDIAIGPDTSLWLAGFDADVVLRARAS